MILFSAYTPHSPLLIESISKDKYSKFHDTVEAIQTLRKRLEDVKPDVIVTISSHSDSPQDAFAINLHDEYLADLKDFGDLATSRTFLPDLELIANIRRSLRTTELAFTLESHASLDYGASVPLLLLNVPANTPIIPITYSGLDPKAHLEFGRLIKDTFGNTRKRVAIIASGDLSHCLSSDAPMGYKKQGRMFDDIILDAIKSMASSKLLQLKPEVVEQAQQCGYRPLLILFGLLERVNVRPDILSYEAPFGVGYLVADFRLPEYDR